MQASGVDQQPGGCPAHASLVGAQCLHQDGQQARARGLEPSQGEGCLDALSRLVAAQRLAQQAHHALHVPAQLRECVRGGAGYGELRIP